MKLPPYGYLSEEYKAALSSEKMEDWQGTQEEYDALINELKSEIAESVWPAWDRTSQTWLGSASSFADVATKQELEIMIDEFQNPDTLQTSPNLHPSVPTERRRLHDWHFRTEDGLRLGHETRIVPPPAEYEVEATENYGANFAFYYPQQDPISFSALFLGDAHKKIHGLFDFKPHFARPRPHQAAMIFGLENFRCHIARTGIHTGTHPSIMSGHCVQGLLLTCHVLEKWLDTNGVGEEQLDAMAQYAADFGDRRVLAGVHYPTDNIASWVIAIRFIPRTFRHVDKILEFAQTVITEKSLVYKIIQNRFRKHESLRNSLDWLNANIQSRMS